MPIPVAVSRVGAAARRGGELASTIAAAPPPYLPVASLKAPRYTYRQSKVCAMRLTCRAALLASLLCLLAPAIARADFGTLYRDYTADSAINGCKYPASELRAGLGQIPADVRQYDPQFELALESALEQRLGGCRAAATAPARGRGIK